MFINTLIILWKGMLAIFLVMGIIYFTIKGLNKITEKEKKD